MPRAPTEVSALGPISCWSVPIDAELRCAATIVAVVAGGSGCRGRDTHDRQDRHKCCGY